jgi:nucleoside-diphosphate-sugar epimerase
MKICIVGGTGNISTAILRRLLDLGHDVTVFNRGQTRVELPDTCRRLTGDRKDRAGFEAMMQREKFDAAIDMICFGPEDAESDMRAFRGTGQFVMTSTVCTYGIQYDYFPTDETHPLRPSTDYGRNKAAADSVFLEAYYREKFPATIIKPSTTYGPVQGMVRQVAWDFSWIDRIRKGKPIVVCGDGNALHQHLHVDDAALAFTGVLGRERCIGQVYNMVNRGYTTWADYHKLAMKVLGREVELVGIPLADLRRMNIPGFGITEEIFAHHVYYSSEKLFRDVPEFQPRVSLEQGMTQVFEAMQQDGRIPNSDDLTWEDQIINAWQRIYA